jgi:hypothetical protein
MLVWKIGRETRLVKFKALMRRFSLLGIRGILLLYLEFLRT